MGIYLEIGEGAVYNRSTGIIRDENRFKKEIELTKAEMEIFEILLDGEWHRIKDIAERLNKSDTNTKVTVSKIRKKIKKYLIIETRYKEGEYKLNARE